MAGSLAMRLHPHDRFDVILFAAVCAFVAFIVLGCCVGWWHVHGGLGVGRY